MRYKTIIEVISDADNEDEAIDTAGEYLRGKYTSDIPLKVRTQSLNRRNYKKLGYTIVICSIALGLSFTWFSASRTYKKITLSEQKALEAYDGAIRRASSKNRYYP